MSENKTKASQIRASMEYDRRNGLVTIACKIRRDFKEKTATRAEEKGFGSINAYLIDLIKNDMASGEQ